MEADVRENALALLRSTNETAKGRTDVLVGPDTATIVLSGIPHGQADEATWWLIENKAIVTDDEMNARASALVAQPTYGMFYVTERGLDLLR